MMDILIVVIIAALGYCTGFVAARSHYTGIPPEDFQDGSAADDGGPTPN